MSDSCLDQNLLFGVLAFQAGLLDPVQFAEACSAWSTRSETALADVLVQHNWLSADERAEVGHLLQRKLKRQVARRAPAQALANGCVAQAEHVTSFHVRRDCNLSNGRNGAGDSTLVRSETTQTHMHVVPATRFERRDLHATGGMGQVWRAYDPELDREIALKVMRRDIVHDREFRERFLQEARIMGQLSHPGIPPIHAISEDERGAPCYAMKFIEGRTLEEAINAYHEQPTPLAFRQLVRHFGDVCQTIAFAHSRSVIHRDLKPRNILIGDFGETYVLDWGLAKQIKPAGGTPPAQDRRDSDQGLTQVGQILGTPAYIPPEQLAGAPAGPLTDLYALGVILYEILAGRPPHDGKGAIEVLLQADRLQIPPPSRLLGSAVPRGLEDICLKAISLVPADRYQTATELTCAVEDWLVDELVRSEASLRESETQIRILLESTAEGIYGADLSGNCIFCNPACARMLGFQDPRDLLGRNMHLVMHHHRADGTEYPVEECRIFQAFREGRGTHVTDEVYWRDDGTPFPVEYWSYPVRRDGQVVGCVVSFMDITERITRERELILAKEASDRACQAARAALERTQRDAARS